MLVMNKHGVAKVLLIWMPCLFISTSFLKVSPSQPAWPTASVTREGVGRIRRWRAFRVSFSPAPDPSRRDARLAMGLGIRS